MFSKNIKKCNFFVILPLQTPRKRQRPVDSKGPTGAGPTGASMDIGIGNQSFLDLFESSDSTMASLDQK